MPFKRTFISAALVITLALAAWAYRDSTAIGNVVKQVSAAVQPVLPKGGGLPAVQGTGASSGELRKCRTASGDLVYTNVECPAGSRLQPIAAGSVTVVPFERRPAPPVASSGAKSPLRALAGPPISEELREKQMEKVINP